MYSTFGPGIQCTRSAARVGMSTGMQIAVEDRGAGSRTRAHRPGVLRATADSDSTGGCSPSCSRAEDTAMHTRPRFVLSPSTGRLTPTRAAAGPGAGEVEADLNVRVALMVGRSMSHYEVLEKLGEGGMGVVYRARDRRLNRHVAIKILPPSLAGDADHMRHLVKEARGFGLEPSEHRHGLRYRPGGGLRRT